MANGAPLPAQVTKKQLWIVGISGICTVLAASLPGFWSFVTDKSKVAYAEAVESGEKADFSEAQVEVALEETNKSLNEMNIRVLSQDTRINNHDKDLRAMRQLLDQILLQRATVPVRAPKVKVAMPKRGGGPPTDSWDSWLESEEASEVINEAFKEEAAAEPPPSPMQQQMVPRAEDIKTKAKKRLMKKKAALK